MKNILYDIVVRLKDAASGGIGTIKSSLTAVTAATQEAGAQTKRYQDLCSKLSYQNFVAMAQAVQNTASALSQLSASGLKFEQSMADLSAITGIAGDDLRSLESSAREMGKASGLGAAAAAESYKVLASSIDVTKIGIEGLNEIQRKTITLSQAAGMSMGDSAAALAGTINQFGLSADAAGRVINVLAAGSKYGAAEIGELSQSFKVVGSTASAMGLSVEQTAGAIEVLSKANVKGSEAGTALRNIVLKLNTELGVDLSKTGLSAALGALTPKLTDATYLSKLFGVENVAAAQYLIKNSAAVAEMTARVTGTNVAMEQAAIRTETTQEKIKRFQARIDDMKISLFQVTGGVSMYASAMSQEAVVASQLIPLYKLLQGGLVSVAGSETVRGLATAATSAVTKTAGAVMVGYQARMVAAQAATAGATLATKLLNMAILASPYVLAAAAVGGLIYGLYRLTVGTSDAAGRNRELTKSLAEMRVEMAQEERQSDALFAALGRTKVGTEDRKRLMGEINSRYGAYLTNQLSETSGLWAIERAQKEVNTQLRASVALRMQQGQREKVIEESTKRQIDLMDDLRSRLAKKLGDARGEEVLGGVTTAINTWVQAGVKYEEIMRRVRGDLERATGEKVGLQFHGDLGEYVRSLMRLNVSLGAVDKAYAPFVKDLRETVTAGGSAGAVVSGLGEEVSGLGEALTGTGKAVTAGISPAIGSLKALRDAVSGLRAQQEMAPPSAFLDFEAKIRTAEGRLRDLESQIYLLTHPVEVGQLDGGSVVPTALPVVDVGGLLDRSLVDTAGALAEKVEAVNRAARSESFGSWGAGLMEASSGAERLRDTLGTLSARTSQTLMGGAKSFSAYGKSVLGSIKEVIGGLIAEGVAVLVTAALKKAALTGPLALIVAPVLAAGAAGLAKTAFNSLVPNFAGGGVVYGDTLARVGEYAGARSNPEVIAPLSKLKDLLAGSQVGAVGAEPVRMEFRIEGRDLVAIYEREVRTARRT